MPALVNFGAMALYTRLVGPVEYGKYAVVLATVSLGNAILFQWLRAGVVRLLPAYVDDTRKFQSTVFAAFAGMVAAVVGAALLAQAVSAGQMGGLLWYAVGLLAAEAWLQLSLEHARARLQPLRYGRLALVNAILTIATATALIALGLGARGLLLSAILGAALPATVALLGALRQAAPALISRRLLGELLAYGAPIAVTSLLAVVIASSDRLLIQHFFGTASVGRYAVGYDLAQQSLTVVFMMISLAATPLAVAAMERGGLVDARRQFAENGELFFAVTIPAAVGLYVVAGPLVDLCVGEPFRAQAKVLLPWIVAGGFLQGVKAYYLDSAFYLARETRLQVLTVLPAAVANILLCIWWLPRVGLIGAAWATVVSYLLALVTSLVFVRRRFLLPVPVGAFVRALAAAVAMGGVVESVRVHLNAPLGVLITVGGVVYALSAAALNVGPARAWLNVLRGDRHGCA